MGSLLESSMDDFFCYLEAYKILDKIYLNEVWLSGKSKQDSLLLIHKLLKTLDFRSFNEEQRRVFSEAMEKISESLFMLEVNQWEKIGMKLGLERMEELLCLLGNPQESISVIHVAGTNGKGSVCNYLQSVLKEAEFSVGMYTSPGITCFNEQIRINDDYITFTKAYELLRDIKEIWNKHHGQEECITFFEAVTAMALVYFRQNKVDFAIIEVGLGGRYDATNIFQHKLLSVITQISLEHIGVLGDTIGKITYNKAGIIQENDHVVVYPSPEEALDVIQEICKEKHASLDILKMENIKIQDIQRKRNLFSYGDIQDIEITMAGEHQIYNCALTLLALKNLQDRQVIHLSQEHIRNGLRKANWPGRLEWISESPTILLDGAHNEDGVKSLVSFLHKQKLNNLKILVGILKDKSHKEMFRLLSQLPATFYLTEVPFEGRKMLVEEMKEELIEFQKEVKTYPVPKEALEAVLKDSGKNDFIVITGSLYLVSELRQYINKKLDI